MLLARRHLRFPFNALFVAAFMARTAPKLLRGGTRREVIAGYREGVRMDVGERRAAQGGDHLADVSGRAPADHVSDGTAVASLSVP